jgi:hypothetical protein
VTAMFLRIEIQYENTTTIPQELESFIGEYNIEHVENDWRRALNQVKYDPEDAITATRAMLESALKWILDDIGAIYKETDNLGQLFKNVAQFLSLSPDQQGEEIFKQILSSINGVVTGLGVLRNAYGKGMVYYNPSERHSKFAINLSGTLCIYLLET